jgi:hypothetical protein
MLKNDFEKVYAIAVLSFITSSICPVI